MSTSIYLFTQENMPGYSKDNLRKINSELIHKLERLARVMKDTGNQDDIKTYYTLADKVHTQVYQKYCGRD